MIKIKINGDIVTKIISLEFDNNLEKPVSVLKLSLPPSVSFTVGKEVEFSFKGTLLFKGILEASTHQKSQTEETKQVSCRSLTHFLIDSCHEAKTWPKENSVKKLLEEIITPLGITPETQELEGINTKKTFAISVGETIFESIERLLKPSGFMMCTKTGADLRVFNPEAKIGALETKKIMALTYTEDLSARFNHIVVIGQDKEKAIRQESRDESISKKKRLVLYETGTKEELQNIANWQIKMRKARSSSLTIQTSEDTLFEAGKILSFEGKDWLISSVNLKIDTTSGTITTLRLKNKEAYKK